MGPGNFFDSGMWIIPAIMILIMLLFAFGIIGRGGFCGPWSRGGGRSRGDGQSSETPMEILKKRYAKGEITKEEFDRIKRDM